MALFWSTTLTRTLSGCHRLNLKFGVGRSHLRMLAEAHQAALLCECGFRKLGEGIKRRVIQCNVEMLVWSQNRCCVIHEAPSINTVRGKSSDTSSGVCQGQNVLHQGRYFLLSARIHVPFQGYFIPGAFPKPLVHVNNTAARK